jgi:hypothetical protein
MNDRELARQQPKNIDEALEYMRTTLEVFHKKGDKRAIFLRLYYIMTLEVHAAIHGLGDYQGRQIFLDAEWVRALSGKFATLYFKGLDTRGREPDKAVERAWKTADKACRSARSTVVQNALLGINAHINYDLPRAIAANLDPGDLKDPPTLHLRKFDHDQVNNLLVRTLRPIQDVLARDYAPGIALTDNLLGNLDERLSEIGLKYYRERVWWDALTYAAALQNGTEGIVRDKLNWESHKVAEVLRTKWELWLPERVLGLPWAVLGTRRWDRITLEPVGGVEVPSGTVVNPLA